MFLLCPFLFLSFCLSSHSYIHFTPSYFPFSLHFCVSSAPFLPSLFFFSIYVCVCVCVCVSALHIPLVSSQLSVCHGGKQALIILSHRVCVCVCLFQGYVLGIICPQDDTAKLDIIGTSHANTHMHTNILCVNVRGILWRLIISYILVCVCVCVCNVCLGSGCRNPHSPSYFSGDYPIGLFHVHCISCGSCILLSVG